MKRLSPILLLSAALLFTACETTTSTTSETPKAKLEAYSAEPVFKGEYVSIGDVDKRPSPIFQTAPVFPHLPNLRITKGEAVVHFIINKEGRVEQAQCSSATNQVFAKSAITALVRSQWNPATLNDAPVNCLVKQKITFEL